MRVWHHGTARTADEEAIMADICSQVLDSPPQALRAGMVFEM